MKLMTAAVWQDLSLMRLVLAERSWFCCCRCHCCSCSLLGDLDLHWLLLPAVFFEVEAYFCQTCLNRSY
jgi:hypothetical protein